MSTPRTKRQFAGAASDPAQRRITSFFPNDPTTTTSSPAVAPARGPLNAPILPAKVQSGLINVGMRVRKALADGSAAQKLPADPAFHLWFDDDDATPSAADKPLPAPRAITYTTSAAAELAPYSGINKIGGLSVQPGVAFSAPSSQESMPSIASAEEAMGRVSGNRKRIFDDNEDDARDEPTPPHAGPWRLREEWIESEISPRSVAPVGWDNARIMAVPRRSGRADKGAAAAADGAARMGQENMIVDDFEEAPFLKFEEEGRMDM
ncbi:putative ribonucleotide reductase [Podospora conica]|nr:putative ribonucleotide reductase [Schizothecium conicum]